MKKYKLLKKLAKYFAMCGGQSIRLQMQQQEAKDYFAIRNAFGISGYMSEEECLEAIEEALK